MSMDPNDQQLELFSESPYAVRISIETAVSFFVEKYWCHLPSNSTTKAHFLRILKFFKGHHLDSISKGDIERFRQWMKQSMYSDATINKGHMVISRLYSWWYELKEGRFYGNQDYSRICLPHKNPASLVPKVNERRFARHVFVTKEQKTLLMSYADEDLSEIIDCLWYTELRESDLFRITSENIDLKRKYISGIQHKTITTKNPGGVPFKVSIPPEKMSVIKRRVESTKPGTPIFRRKNLLKRWHKVRELAGFPDLQLRDLRGSAATYLLDNGVDPETVRKTLGHTTLRMLPVYDKRPEESVKIATQKLV